ncbi:hypothetical protein Poli38472_014433 [Pythium oligandrum]|uniref:Ankyrin repeat protein n=1 Tax=Pythium oligandrum TaxID=41045 RepID=A0A8K1C7Q1_PYTOL|nr:hypothetical protein Poli38472_014433 [Pythium oligandrum]|eukprot:TMW57830.1 hypothetical protein Poli38472_014433 [Pythium oligandrum]
MLDVYERAVFTPSREAATQGSFLRSYMLSLDMSAGMVDALFRDKKLPGSGKMRKTRESYFISDISRIYSLLTQNDLAVIRRESSPMSKSLKELLDGVAELSRQELFESRVLSRDMLKLSDDITDIFKALCVALGRENELEGFLARGILEKSKQTRLLEEGVMFSMLPLLDRLELDGSIRDDKDDNVQLLTVDLNGDMVSIVCRQVANVIATHFEESEKEAPWIEDTYFVFPDTPNWVSLEFGDVKFLGEEEGEIRDNLFGILMGMLHTSDGPLTGLKLKFFKFSTTRDPGVLSIEYDIQPGVTPRPEHAGMDKLPMLLHQAAAGPGRDKRLVEFMVQMGALYNLPLHWRYPPAPGTLPRGVTRGMFCNQAPVHSAAELGMTDIVRILVAADHMRDMNTPTFHTKETLLHLAAKNGHQQLYEMLLWLGADV